MILDNPDRDLAELESDLTLFDPDQLHRRLEAIDALDTLVGNDGPGTWAFRQDEATIPERARVLRKRLEDANTAVYQAIRQAIQQGAGAATLLRWIDRCRDGSQAPVAGLGYDALDELIAGVLQVREPENGPAALEPEQVFYQPTPVRHALEMIQISGLTKGDVLIDLGSGLGHVCMLASILTGARAIGIEVETAYSASARACARSLGLDRVSFIQQDARTADLSIGTVFYLYTPFSGSILTAVLNNLESESRSRSIRMGTLGPCTRAVAEESWLRMSAPPRVDRVAVFHSLA